MKNKPYKYKNSLLQEGKLSPKTIPTNTYFFFAMVSILYIFAETLLGAVWLFNIGFIGFALFGLILATLS